MDRNVEDKMEIKFYTSNVKFIFVCGRVNVFAQNCKYKYRNEKAIQSISQLEPY